MSEPKIPTVVLIGRTNVGKSTLFNKFLERQKALVSKVPGTTRDRNEGDCLWRGKNIRIIDTGGLDVDLSDEIEKNIQKQAKLAMKRADIILFVVDLKTGPLPQEQTLAAELKKSKTPVIMVGNKAEKPAERISVENAEWRLQGLEKPIAISALRGSGIGDLLDVIYNKLEDIGKPPVDLAELKATKIAVIGKPNVGKSTLINAIVGEERFITSAIAHTTREPNDTLVTVDEKNYIFIDTAGMRKKGKVRKAGGLEQAAVHRNERIVRYADVSLLVVDASEPIGTQEKVLAGFLKNTGSGVIVVANKWDLVEDKKTNTMNDYKKYFEETFPFLKFAPILFVSAIEKQRVKNLFAMIDEVQKHRETLIPPDALEQFMQNAIKKHAPSKGKGPKPPKVLGITQVGVCPPTFDLMLKAKRTDVIHPSYISYLKNRLLIDFGLTGTPVRINVKIATSVSK